jgi:lipoate-protein ligase A
MDIDAALLAESANFAGKPLVRIYEWDRPSATIGYVQKESAVKDPDKYTVAKRPTGGGVVYHDNDFTYSVIVPAGHPVTELDRVESYHYFHRAVVRALAGFGIECFLAEKKMSDSVNRSLMQCFTTPTKYDVLCKLPGVSGGRAKIAGSAQRRTKNGILHQGSIMIDLPGISRADMKSAFISAFENEFNITFTNYNYEA